MLVKDNVTIAAAARAIVRMNASSANEATTRDHYNVGAAECCNFACRSRERVSAL
jgi:hypothetical protein